MSEENESPGSTPENAQGNSPSEPKLDGPADKPWLDTSELPKDTPTSGQPPPQPVPGPSPESWHEASGPKEAPPTPTQPEVLGPAGKPWDDTSELPKDTPTGGHPPPQSVPDDVPWDEPSGPKPSDQNYGANPTQAKGPDGKPSIDPSEPKGPDGEPWIDPSQPKDSSESRGGSRAGRDRSRAQAAAVAAGAMVAVAAGLAAFYGAVLNHNDNQGAHKKPSDKMEEPAPGDKNDIDRDKDGKPDDPHDADGDGIPDNQDSDANGDGITDNGKPWPKPGGYSRGDPRLLTFDGKEYMFQAVGEFVLTKSKRDDFEVQVRYAKVGAWASKATAVAMQVHGQRVAIYARPENPVLVDGKPLVLATGKTSKLQGGGQLTNEAGNYVVRWKGGGAIKTIRKEILLNLDLWPAAEGDGSLQGLLGDNDGNADNDLRTGTGDVVQLLGFGKAREDYETLYRRFGESWRITQDKSLFDYAPGETTATFTDRAHPEKYVTLNDLSERERASAEKTCRDAGVKDAAILDGCVLDVALSGDPSFAALAALTDPTGVTVEFTKAPKTIDAGADIEICWRVTAGRADVSDAVVAYDLDSERLDYSLSLHSTGAADECQKVVARNAGRFEFRYHARNSATVRAASEPVDVRAQRVTLRAPETVHVGEEFEVCWEFERGRPQDADLVAVYNVGGAWYEYTDWKSAGGTAQGCRKLVAPVGNGPLEVRFRPDGGAKHVATSKPIEVQQVAMTLTVPDTVHSGAELEVCWKITDGTPSPEDQVALYKPGAAWHEYAAWATTGGTAQGCKKLVAPVGNGPLEVRYRPHGGAKHIATSKQITVKQPRLALTVPDTVHSGAELQVCWKITDGTPSPEDQVALYKRGAAWHEYADWATTGGTAQGCKKLTAPVGNAPLEVRYRPHGKPQPIATSRPITVKQPKLTLTVPDTVHSGAELQVCWKITDGTPSPEDQVALYKRGAAWHEYADWATTGGTAQGCKKLTAPVGNAPLEVRYRPHGKPQPIATSRPITVR